MSDDVRQVLGIARRCGIPAERVEFLPGVVNVVARIRVTGGADAVVRLPADPRRPDEFAVEEWAYRAAESAGIPSPRVIARGEDDGTPYLVLEYVDATAPALPNPWTTLGDYAARIARIPVDENAPPGLFSRFGRDLPHAWREHIAYNIASLTPDDDLIDLGVYAPGQRHRLLGMLESLQDIPFSFGLCHGDLAPRNLIPRDGAPVLIDWGTASTGPAPWTDVQQVYQWCVEDDVVTHAEFRAFAIAAGVHPEADGSVLDALTALRHLDLVRWAIVQRPELTIDYVRSAQRGLRADRR